MQYDHINNNLISCNINNMFAYFHLWAIETSLLILKYIMRSSKESPLISSADLSCG